MTAKLNEKGYRGFRAMTAHTKKAIEGIAERLHKESINLVIRSLC